MLAKPTKAIGEVLNRFEGKEFTCEYKYDGERAQVCSSNLVGQAVRDQDVIWPSLQIHRLENGQLVVFSRNSENMSAKYPDLIDSMSKVRCNKFCRLRLTY
jgi:DNA ligase-1